jgi:hypothetical protein
MNYMVSLLAVISVTQWVMVLSESPSLDVCVKSCFAKVILLSINGRYRNCVALNRLYEYHQNDGHGSSRNYQMAKILAAESKLVIVVKRTRKHLYNMEIIQSL